MRTVLMIVVAITLLCAANAAIARDYYVDNLAGDDTYDGLAPDVRTGASGPVRTIAKALRLCEKGDRVVLTPRDQPYREMISLSAGHNWGFASQKLTIDGQGAILDGTLPVPPRTWEFYEREVFGFQPPALSHQQLYLDGKPAVQKLFEPLRSTPATLEPLEWMLHEGTLYFRPAANHLPEDYDLSYAGLQTGITLYHVRHVRIENMVVQGFRLDGVNFHDGCVDCELVNVTARGNGRSGVSIGGSSRALIENCLIGDNGVAQVRIEGYSIANLKETEIVANTAPAYEIEGGKLFVDGVRVERNEASIPADE